MFVSTIELSDQEIRAILNRTLIPTVVIEGKSDLFLFRRIESDIGATRLSLLAVGGRTRVISAFEEFEEAAKERKLFFFCDKDEWEFSGIPQRFDHSNFETTSGNSIENDLLSDGNTIACLYPDEIDRFWHDIERFCHWFSIQMARFLNGIEADLSKYPPRFLDDQNEFEADCLLAAEEQDPLELREDLQSDPLRKARGKSLMQILCRYLNAPGRAARHNPNALLENGAAARGANFTRVYEWITNGLAE